MVWPELGGDGRGLGPQRIPYQTAKSETGESWDNAATLAQLRSAGACTDRHRQRDAPGDGGSVEASFHLCDLPRQSNEHRPGEPPMRQGMTAKTCGATLSLAMAWLIGADGSTGHAQGFPSRPVKIITDV